VAKLQGLYRVAGLLADDVELALQRVLVHLLPAPRDEDLPDDGLDVLGALGKAAVRRRHVAPAEQDLAFARHRPLDLLLAGHPRCRLFRQEHHANAVLADRRERKTLRAARLAEKAVGQLDQDPAPSPCSGSAPVAPRCERFRRICNACVMMAWRFSPLMCAMKPKPHASCSFAGS
jgi:hypothetical protein